MPMTEKGKSPLIWKCHVTMTKEDAFISNDMQLQNHSLTFIHKNKSLLSGTSILSRSAMDHNSTASLGKLTCTDRVDFGNCQDRFGRFCRSKNDSRHLDVKLKVFTKDRDKEFELVLNLTMGEVDFNRLMRLSNQMVNAAEIFAREENLTTAMIPITSEDMDEQLKLAHKVVDVVDRADRKICVTVVRYNVDKLESSYAQVQSFARNKEDEKFQQVVYAKYKLEEVMYLFDVMNSVYD